MNYKIRESVMNKNPYTLILGNNEESNKTISYRICGQDKTLSMDTDEFIEKLLSDIKERKYNY